MLTIQEEKIARLALDRAAAPGEIASAANKLICSWRNRKVTVEQIGKTIEVERIVQVEVPSSGVWGPARADLPVAHKICLICLGVVMFFSITMNVVMIAGAKTYTQPVQVTEVTPPKAELVKMPEVSASQQQKLWEEALSMFDKNGNWTGKRQ